MGDEVLKQRKDGAENRSGMDRVGQGGTERGKKKEKSTGTRWDGTGHDKIGIRQGRHERTGQNSTYERITCFFSLVFFHFARNTTSQAEFVALRVKRWCLQYKNMNKWPKFKYLLILSFTERESQV